MNDDKEFKLSVLSFEFNELMGQMPFENVYGYDFDTEQEQQIKLVEKLIKEKRFPTAEEVDFLIERVVTDE